MVVPTGSETCQSILTYLNSFDTVGKYYCSNTTVRGGWSLTPCAGAAGEPETSMRKARSEMPIVPTMQTPREVRP